MSFVFARAIGTQMAGLCARRAEDDVPDFSERARAFVLRYLRDHGVSSSELITDAAKLAGLVRTTTAHSGGVSVAGQAQADRGASASAPGTRATARPVGACGAWGWSDPMKDEFIVEGSSREECVVVVPVQGIIVYLNAEGMSSSASRRSNVSSDQEDQFTVPCRWSRPC